MVLRSSRLSIASTRRGVSEDLHGRETGAHGLGLGLNRRDLLHHARSTITSRANHALGR